MKPIQRMVQVLTVAALLFFGACSGDNGKETFETAKLEEVQKNFTHAAQLYREVIEKHPESEYATQAAERLKAMEKK